MTLRVCVSIMPRNPSEALKLIGKAEKAGADLIEIRLDSLDASTALSEIAAQGKIPKIATNKQSSLKAEERFESLLKAAKSGFEYVDVDLSYAEATDAVPKLKRLSAKCIVSFHDNQDSPTLPELQSILDREIAAGADICKIVTTPKEMSSNLTLFQFTQEASAKAKVVCFGMGEVGRTSRLLSPAFGGFFTFASLEKGGETAPGQMTLKEMRAAYELLGLK